MGLGTRRAPLTALVPAENKGQHLFGGGGQRHAHGHGMGVSLWGTDGRGASDTAAGEPLVLRVCGSEPKHGLVLLEELCSQGRTWGQPG